MKIYKIVSLLFMVIFAVTGLFFLFAPDQVLTLFNNVSPFFGLPEAPLTGFNFFLILAVAYMYMVTIIAFLMFRHPENRTLPQLLLHAKIASSLLSLALFLFHENYLIYIANCLIDGTIGAVVVTLYFKTRSIAH